jgi:hypothetical protein
MGKEYLERLLQVQALERSKEALDELNKSAVNLVQGYKYQATIFEHANARTFVPPLLPPPVLDRPPFPPKTSEVVQGDLIIPVILDGVQLGKVVLKDFKKKASQQYGDSTKWSAIQ